MKKGFTIGEIFTALIIIGILIAVLAPSVKNLTNEERREAIIFKKAYYALEKAVEASINDNRYYVTGEFSDTNNASVDGKTYSGKPKFREVIKDHFNVIEEQGNSFTIKDDVKYIIEDDDFSGDSTNVTIELDNKRERQFNITVYSNGRMEIPDTSACAPNSDNNQCKAKRYLEKQGI